MEELVIVDPPIWSKKVCSEPITSVTYNNQGNRVAFSTFQGEIYVSSIYDGSFINPLEQSYTTSPITSCHFHPIEDNFLLCSTRDGFIFLFDLVKGEIANFSRHLGSNILSMAIDPYGESFAIGCADGSIRIHNIDSLQRMEALVKKGGRTSMPSTSHVYSVLYYPDDPNIVISTSGSDKLAFWDLRIGNYERILSGINAKYQNSIDVYSTNIIVASSRDSKQLEVYDFGTCKKIRELNIDNPQPQLPKAPHGLEALSSRSQNVNNQNSVKNSIYAFNNQTSKPPSLNCVSVARNGSILVTGGSVTNQCQAFNYVDGNLFGFTKAGNSPITVVSVSPFGSSFVCGSETGLIQCRAIRYREEI